MIQMLLYAQFILLVGLVPVTLVIMARCEAKSGQRVSFWERFQAALSDGIPFLLIGIFCILLLSANGRPFLEWVIPGTSLLLLRLFCDDHRLVSNVKLAYLIVSLVLCTNFMFLINNGYTANPEWVLRISDIGERQALKFAADAIEERFLPHQDVPAGSLANVLDEPSLNSVPVMRVESEWHTFLTRLNRVNRQPGIVWSPGGKVQDAITRLEIRITDVE